MDRTMLNKATTADDTPTPGYMYGDIAKMTFADVSACQQIADYLLNKLQRDNPHVKLKVLKIIRNVCENGKADFRRAIQKKADVVKGCLQYRGSPDPLKGDAPNKMVRDEADVAIKAVFSADSSTNAYGLSTEKKMQGFGSDSQGSESQGSCGNSSFTSYGGGGGGGGGAGQKSFGSSGAGGMVGFGNPNFNNDAPKEQGSQFKNALEVAGGYLSKMKDKVSSNITGQSATSSTNDPNTNTYRAPNMNLPQMGSFGSGNVQGRWGDNSRPVSNAGGGGGSTSTSTGEYEARVVSDFCAPGGPRVAPSAAALEDFCRKAESLDASQVARQLRTKLEDQAWQTRLKALHAIEALHEKGLDGIVGHITNYSSELIFECQDMPQCKSKATKVLSLLGLVEESAATPAPQARAEPASAPAPPPVATFDLLTMDDGPSVAPSAQAAPPPTMAADTLDMLGGDMLGAPTVAEPAAPSAGGGGLFGGMELAGPSSQPAATSTPAYTPPPVSQGTSLLDGLNQAGPPAPALAPDAGGGLPGMFGNLNLGGSEGAAQPAAAPAPAPAAVPDLMGGLLGNTAPSQPAEQNRTQHFNVLSGGMGGPAMGAPMGQMGGMPGAMGGMGAGNMGGMPGAMGAMGAMGNPGMGHPGMMAMGGNMGGAGRGMMPGTGGPMGMMGGQMGGPMGMQGAMGGPMNMMGGQMGMMGPQMTPQGMMAPQMMQQPGAMMGGYGGPGSMPGGPSQAGGSAFGFIGGGSAPGGSAMGNDVFAAAAPPAKNDSAFSFVVDEIKGAS
mmetsp:Transcript_86167/g.157095  ORF Transcript_86167/g.157095 Transcript_86167/m.157095 type:complete len:780 (+) Transcript_86167:79-2418(+)